MKPSKLRKIITLLSLIYFIGIFIFLITRDPIERSLGYRRPKSPKPLIKPTTTAKIPFNFNLPSSYWKSQLTPEKEVKFSDIESEIIRLSNEFRKKNGLKELYEDENLNNVARYHSKDMANKSYFSYISPDGMTPQMRKEKLYSALYGGIGENIFKVENYQNATPDRVALLAFNNWINSSGPRDNIINAEYTHIGVGVVLENNFYYITQNLVTAIAKFEQNLPETINVSSPLFFRGQMLTDEDKSKIEFLLTRPRSTISKFYGFQKSNYEQIQPTWIDDRRFECKVDFEKGGIYKLIIAVSGKMYDGHPIQVK